MDHKPSVSKIPNNIKPIIKKIQISLTLFVIISEYIV